MTKDPNKPEDDTPKKPEFSPTRGGFEIGSTEPTPEAKGERAKAPAKGLVVDIFSPEPKKQ